MYQMVTKLCLPRQLAMDARLGLAVTRGLLLDLLATGDRETVAAVFERLLSLAAAAGRPGGRPWRPADDGQARSHLPAPPAA